MLLRLGLLTVCFMSGIQTETYKKVGGKAVLSPGSVNGPITGITWKHGADIAVEWYGQEVFLYRDFKGRCELNTITGALTISNLLLKDSGIYTAEINSRVMNTTTKIRVITPVPKPTISTDCNPERTVCTLTCNANIPETTGPVTYSWTMGDAVNLSTTSQLNIAKNDTESVGKLISCQLENPVGSERSDDITSPFTSGSSVGGIAAAVLIPLVLLAGIGLLVHYLFWRRNNRDNAGCQQYFTSFKTRNRLNREGEPLNQEQMNGTETAALAPTQNGGGPDLSAQETSRSTVVPTFPSPSETFSLENKTDNHDQNLGPPDVQNETETYQEEEEEEEEEAT